MAEMRGVKAEGGWAVVCTEEVQCYWGRDIAPFGEGSLIDEDDLPMHELMVEKVHAHGALAGCELVHSGHHTANLEIRTPPLGVGSLPVTGIHPVQARAMTARDIADLRRWHRQGVQRAMRAGYDLVYVYAGHGLSTIQAFLSRRFNKRNDAYGGPLENRARLLRETLEDTLEVAEGRVGVACRLCVDELVGADGLERPEIEELLGMLGELPDLWDFMVGDWDFDSLTSRFSEEGSQEPYVRGLKALTSKPVVGVGRFTSADMMVRMIRDGVLDMIGSARPSIADPFLPNKIRDGRWEDIRECIGCEGGIQSASARSRPAPRFWWWEPGRLVSRPRCPWASAATKWCSPTRRRGCSAVALCSRRVYRAWRLGFGSWTIGWLSCDA
jgi:dimethylamine/trimethylamine dehydrogenase